MDVEESQGQQKVEKGARTHEDTQTVVTLGQAEGRPCVHRMGWRAATRTGQKSPCQKKILLETMTCLVDNLPSQQLRAPGKAVANNGTVKCQLE